MMNFELFSDLPELGDNLSHNFGGASHSQDPLLQSILDTIDPIPFTPAPEDMWQTNVLPREETPTTPVFDKRIFDSSRNVFPTAAAAPTAPAPTPTTPAPVPQQQNFIQQVRQIRKRSTSLDLFPSSPAASPVHLPMRDALQQKQHNNNNNNNNRRNNNINNKTVVKMENTHLFQRPQHSQQQQQQIPSRNLCSTPTHMQQSRPRLDSAPSSEPQQSKACPPKANLHMISKRRFSDNDFEEMSSPHKMAKPNRILTSKYRGVCWYRRTQRWVVQIKLNGMRKHVGYFKDEEEAARAYLKALAELTAQTKGMKK